MPKRANNHELPDPERVCDRIVQRCRREIEGPAKRLVRRMLVPIQKRRYRLAELGEGFHWQRGREIIIAPGSKVGRFAYLGGGFEAHGPVVIGDLCMLAAGLKVIGADHLHDIAGTPTRLAFPVAPRPVTIFGADVWTGLRVTVMEGVTIGTGAVIASGAVVTRDVPAYTVMAGVPARPVKQRFDPATRDTHHAAVMAGRGEIQFESLSAEHTDGLCGSH